MTETSGPPKSPDSSSERVIIQINASVISFAANTDLGRKEPITTESFSAPLITRSFLVHGDPASFLSDLLHHLALLMSAAMSQKNLQERIIENRTKSQSSLE